MENEIVKERVAIIGGGGSGLTTAWLLEEKYHVTLYESRDRLGGHIDSAKVGDDYYSEAGVEFFCKSTYPIFIRFLKYLDIDLNSFRLDTTWYNTNGKDTIILPPSNNGKLEWTSTTPKNLNRMVQFKRLLDRAKILIEREDTGMILKTFVDSVKLTEDFKEDFLYPYLSSGWGVTSDEIKDFSAYNILKHPVKGQENDWTWLEVIGGLTTYIRALEKQLKSTEIILDESITSITYSDSEYDNSSFEKYFPKKIYSITDSSGNVRQYEHVVIATHADQAGNLIAKLPDRSDLCAILQNVRYVDTVIALHGDDRFVPKEKDRSVVNVRYNGTQSALTVYKKRPGKPPCYKTWITYDVRDPNDDGESEPEPLYHKRLYKHAATDIHYFNAQNTVKLLNGRNNLWFAGAWTYDNDSHESAIISAMKIAEKLHKDSARLEILK